MTKQGEAQLNRGEFQAAVASYRQALQIYQELQQTNDAGAGEALKGLGKAYLLLGNYPQAIAIFRQLAQDGFAKEPALSNLGLALFRAGQLSEAEQTLKAASAGWESLRATERDDLNKVTLFHCGE